MFSDSTPKILKRYIKGFLFSLEGRGGMLQGMLSLPAGWLKVSGLPIGNALSI